MSYRLFPTDTWNRKSTFDFFRAFDDPFFQVTVPVEVTQLYSVCKARDESFFLASLYHATRAANAVPEFRLRIQEQEVREWEVIHPGSTVLNADNTFSFGYFTYFEDKNRFIAEGEKYLQKLREDPDFLPGDDTHDMIHFSVLPWLAFTGFKHARRFKREDSVPKIVFGKYEKRGEALWMPVSVEVHHALMDGYHVGLFFDLFQKSLNDAD